MNLARQKGVAIYTALCLLAITSGCSDNDATTRALGTLERDRIELTAESTEPITRIIVREGDTLSINDIIIEQDVTRANIALARARADEAVARSALSEAEAGPRAQQIRQGRARLAAASSATKTVHHELQRELTLADRKLSSQNRVDILQGRYNEAEARKREAQAAFDQLLEGTRSEVIDQARSKHAAATAMVEDLNISLDRAKTRSPVSGLVEALPFDIGERPPFGATVAVILSDDRSYARVHVSEPLRAQLKNGTPAEVWIDGKEAPLAGRLRWISANAAFTPYYALNQHDRAHLSYLAEIDLTDNDNDLPIGIPVEVSFPTLVEQ